MSKQQLLPPGSPTTIFARAHRVDGRWRFTVRCPFCGQRHTHGKGAGMRRPPMDAGYRGAHCGRGGYEVVVRNGSETRL